MFKTWLKRRRIKRRLKLLKKNPELVLQVRRTTIRDAELLERLKHEEGKGRKIS